MKNQFFNSNLFLNLVRISVVISGMFFMGDGCKNDPVSPEEVINAWAGKWELSWTTVSSDSVFVHKAWVILNKDSTFSCNASFFLRSDSLKVHSINGQWSIYIPDNTPFIVNHPKSDRIGLTSGTLSSYWDIYGGVSEGYMNWVGFDDQYDWHLIK